MSKKKDPAHGLIQSLTTNERRYFNLYSSITSGDAHYKKLFAVLSEMKEYNAGELKAKLADTGMNISYEKNYLQKLLLRTLRNFNEDNGIELSLHQLLMDAEILFNKQQYDLCEQFISLGKERSKEHELATYLLHFVKWERKLLVRRGSYALLSKYNKILRNEEINCLREIENLSAYRDLQAAMLGIIAHKGNVFTQSEMKSLDAIITHPLLQSPKQALSFHALVIFYELWIWYYNNTYKLDEAYRMSKEGVAMIESRPDKLRMAPQNYMAFLSGLVNRCGAVGKYDEALEVINKMENIPNIKNIVIPHSLQTEIKSFVIERRIMIYSFMHRFEDCVMLYENTQAEMSRERKRVRESFYYMYYFYAAMSYLYTGDHVNALKILRTVLDGMKDHIRKDMFLYAHMLHSTVHYELKNYELVPYLIKSTKHYAKSRGFKGKTVLRYGAMLTELMKNKDNRQGIKSVLLKFKKEFLELDKMESESVIQGSIELHWWLNYKLKQL